MTKKLAAGAAMLGVWGLSVLPAGAASNPPNTGLDYPMRNGIYDELTSLRGTATDDVEVNVVRVTLVRKYDGEAIVPTVTLTQVTPVRWAWRASVSGGVPRGFWRVTAEAVDNEGQADPTPYIIDFRVR